MTSRYAIQVMQINRGTLNVCDVKEWHTIFDSYDATYAWIHDVTCMHCDALYILQIIMT